MARTGSNYIVFGLIISLVHLGIGTQAMAVDAPCPERPIRVPKSKKAAVVKPENPSTDLHARELRTDDQGVTELTGDVLVERGSQSLRAEHLFYSQNTDRLEASGKVTFRDSSGLSFLTDRTEINLESRIGQTGSGLFRFEDGSARGSADRIEFDGPNLTRFSRVRYTTCAEGQDDWFLKMKELELDTDENIGTARHTSLEFLGVPILYMPYFNFPISDERKSGFLIPHLGYSGNRGVELGTPYYFNLAPQLDDTFTPEIMSKRGLQLQNEFRYLTRNAHGDLQFEILPNDRQANGDNRAAGSYQHFHTFSPEWSGIVDVRGISDKSYFEDFRDDLNITSQTHLPQNAQLNYRGPRWNFTARAADYQTIDRSIPITDRPYARLPQLNLSLNAPYEPNRLQFGLENELVYFERDASQNGGRFSFNPTLSLPLANSYAFFTPRVGLHYVGYRLSEVSDDNPSLTRGVYSLDSGLFLERDSRWNDHLFTQTLEPRLFYLYVPYKNQDNLPNFDTSVPDFSFYSLFRENRFVGGDRIGDANQITAALTTRFIDQEDGTERVRFSLGRIYYLEDRQVNLPSGIIQSSSSDIVAEASATLANHWYVRSSVDLNRGGHYTQRNNYYLQYNPSKDRIISIGRRYARDEMEQTDISTEWPLSPRWTFRARALHSQEGNRNLDTYAGLEYNSCCWAIRVLGRKRLFIDQLNPDVAEQHFSIVVQLELTGLSKLGHAPETPLHESMFYTYPKSRAAAPQPYSP